MIDRRKLLAGLAGLGATTALPALAQGIGRQSDPYAQVDPYADPRNGFPSGGGADADAPPPRKNILDGHGEYSAAQEAEEIAQGKLSYNYNMKRWGGAHPDPRLQQALRDFFLPMTRAAQRSHLPWEVTLVVSNDANACAMAGGKVLVTTGLIPICDRPGELAATLAHEIGHVDLGHVVNHENDLDPREVAVLLEQQGSGANVEQALLKLGVKISAAEFFTNAYSREDEYAADEHAFYVFGRLGIDPIHIVNDQKNFMMMANLRGGQPSEYLMTHPRTENRVANVERIFSTMVRVPDTYRFAGWDILKAAFPTLPQFKKA